MTEEQREAAKARVAEVGVSSKGRHRGALRCGLGDDLLPLERQFVDPPQTARDRVFRPKSGSVSAECDCGVAMRLVPGIGMLARVAWT